MSWDAYQSWRGNSAEILDATTHVTTLLMERAPDTTDVFEYVATSAPVVLSSYALSAQDAALDYLGTAQKASGLAPVLYQPTLAAVTWTMLEPIVKWALTDIVIPWTIEQVLPRMVQGTTRLIANVGRETVQAGVGEIDDAYGRRVPRAGACAWCRLQSSVTHWSGEWPDSSYHGHCRCEPIVMIDGRNEEVPDSVYDLWEDYDRQYLDADEWARKEQTRLNNELWERANSGPGSFSSKKRQFGSLRRKELPTLQQLTLSRMRDKYDAR